MMTTTIKIITLLITLIASEQALVTIRHPIGPTFTSAMVTRPKLYYNNLGIRLDCTAAGDPLPTLTWFRTNGSNTRQWLAVQSSELIDVLQNGSVFIRPFREYIKAIHAAAYVCRAENPVGSIQTIAIQIKPQIYDAYEIEVKTPYGFEQSSVVISCDISPPLANAYVQVIGWLERRNGEIAELNLKPKTKYNLLSNRNLIIHNLSKSEDNRSYACVVQNDIDKNVRQSRFKSLRIRDRSPFGPELSIPNNTEYRAQAGEVIELPCGISSIPSSAHISWWKDGTKLRNREETMYNTSLTLQLASSADSGNYACRVDDESIGRMTSTISLKVNVPTKCDMNVPATNVSAGSTVELRCTVNSIRNVSSHWQWYYNSMLLADSADRYVISEATREKMGMYQCCFVSSSSDLDSCCAQTPIRVIDSPPFIFLDQQAQLNSVIILSPHRSRAPLDLNCTVYGDPIPDIQIFKDGRRLSPPNPIEYLASGDVALRYPIHVSNIADTGLYECVANNSFGMVSSSKHINVERQTPFIQPLSNLTIRSGQKFTLTCYASGQPSLHLQWIDTTTNRIMNTSSVSPAIFTSVNTHSSLYTCLATNPYGQISSQVSVTVQIPAKVLSITPNRTVKINESLDIHCSAEGDNQLELTLKNPSLRKLPATETKLDNQKNLSMTINSIQIVDSGLYECHARNNYSEAHAVFEIVVLDAPEKIENILIDKSQRLIWMEPFDGNSRIAQYILRMRYKQGLSWSNETVVVIDSHDTISYSFENVFSTCMISVIIQAINAIGASLPSDPFRFHLDTKPLRISPHNLMAVNISSNSVTLAWQYPSFHICNSLPTEFVVEITDPLNQTGIHTHNDRSTAITLHQLKSFTNYTFAVYATNELGSSPKSTSLNVQTLENVPLLMIEDLTASLLNSSTASVSWTFEPDRSQSLNGRFRTFSVTIYRNFNMSTLTTVETTNSSYLLADLQPSAQYYISVAVCNFFDCGPSSMTVDVETPASSFDASTTVLHPINKPLVINCPSSPHNSLTIPHPSLSETNAQYQCESKLYHIRYYDKPSSIRTKLHYALPNEIGLKVFYPPEIVESLTITYKTKDNPYMNEMNIFPPLSNIRLTNLSCGSPYEIMVYASNQAGFSLTEHVLAKTTGSVPVLTDPSNLVQTISNDHIVLHMASWVVDECPVLSYEIELLSTKTNLSRFFSYTHDIKEIKIDNLQPNEDYQLSVKVSSPAGENVETISFRTVNEQLVRRTKTERVAISFGASLLLIVSILMILKLCRPKLRRTELFVDRTSKLKPITCPPREDNFQKAWVRTEKEFTLRNYVNKSRSDSLASEDSQGNINPYAVTGYAMNYKDEANHGSFWRDPKHRHCQAHTADPRPTTAPTQRYFRPIILESSLSHDQDLSRRNPLVQISEKPFVPNLQHTVSSSQAELFSAFTYVSSSKPLPQRSLPTDQSSSSADSGVHSFAAQSPRCPVHNYAFDQSSFAHPRTAVYATYGETSAEACRRQHYSLV